jgi:hypothetical protein
MFLQAQTPILGVTPGWRPTIDLERAKESAPFPEKGEAECALPALRKAKQDAPFREKGEAVCTFFA